MLVRVNVDQHGTAPVTIVCDTADDGGFAIPVALIDAMFDAGVSGFPSGALVRRTVDRTAGDAGCIDLHVASERQADVVVAR
jgi:hypothetical protein